MELLESDDPKAHLLRKAAGQKQALNEEVKLISDKTEKVIKTALIVGGTLAATYLIYNLLSNNSSKKKKKKIKVVRDIADDDEEEVVVEANDSAISGVITKLGTVFASQATVFLLSLAKEKLGEYLENRSAKKDDNTL
jgi:hypothetical protein